MAGLVVSSEAFATVMSLRHTSSTALQHLEAPTCVRIVHDMKQLTRAALEFGDASNINNSIISTSSSFDGMSTVNVICNLMFNPRCT